MIVNTYAYRVPELGDMITDDIVWLAPIDCTWARSEGISTWGFRRYIHLKKVLLDLTFVFFYFDSVSIDFIYSKQKKQNNKSKSTTTIRLIAFVYLLRNKWNRSRFFSSDHYLNLLLLLLLKISSSSITTLSSTLIATLLLLLIIRFLKW